MIPYRAGALLSWPLRVKADRWAGRAGAVGAPIGGLAAAIASVKSAAV
jgi:hypothetical protein